MALVLFLTSHPREGEKDHLIFGLRKALAKMTNQPMVITTIRRIIKKSNRFGSINNMQSENTSQTSPNNAMVILVALLEMNR